MYITPINSINISKEKTSFKSIRPKINKTAAKDIMETALSAAAVYGIIHVMGNKGKEKQAFIETKTDENIVSIKLNSKGEEESRTIIKPSNIAGEYNITKNLPNGEKEVISSANIDKSGHFDIQKEFVSPSGMLTFYKRIGKCSKTSTPRK